MIRHLVSLVTLLGCATLFGAQPDYSTIFLTISGTLGPVVNSGSDCFGLNGQAASVTVMLQAADGPFHTTKHTASYPAAISGNVGPLSLSGCCWEVTYAIAKDHNAITFTGHGPMASVIELEALIPPGTISRSVFKHPQPLPAGSNPEPLSYPGSSVSYTAPGCSATQLALTGQLAGSTQ